MKRNTANCKKLNWTAEQQKLLAMAQGGDKIAQGKLYASLHEFLKMVYSHTQDGQFPSKFSNTFNFSGRTFEEAASDVYGVFDKCVREYDSSYGVPFGAFLVGELKHRAMDWVRNRQNNRLVRVGQRVSVDDEKVLDATDYEKACDDYYAEISGDSSDAETHPVEYAENMELFNMVFATVRESGDEKLIKFLDEYFEYGLEKNGMEIVAERMDVTRTATYNYLKQVRNLLRPKFGDFFANAA